jgi:hypothetical protein
MQGTPAYFKKQLRKDLVMVKKYDVPTLFATIPAHEVSHMRWSDCQGMEDIIAKFLNHCVDHTALPVKNATLFVHGPSSALPLSPLLPPRGTAFFSDCTNRYLALLVSGVTTANQERLGLLHYSKFITLSQAS